MCGSLIIERRIATICVTGRRGPAGALWVPESREIVNIYVIRPNS